MIKETVEMPGFPKMGFSESVGTWEREPEAVFAAEEYYNTIKESNKYPAIAAALKAAIDTAKESA